jgi:hemerythrin
MQLMLRDRNLIDINRNFPSPVKVSRPLGQPSSTKLEASMALITWSKETLGTNVSIADEQHKILFDMLNALDDSVAGGNRQAVGQKLDTLVNFVVEHFAEEEKLMQTNGYPDYPAHKAEHEKLLDTCGGVHKKFHAGETEITRETTTFVKDWLLSHIPKIDASYGPFLNSKGIS